MAASQPIVLQQLTSNATGSPNPTDESPPLDMAPSQVHEGQPDQSYPIMAVARPIVPQQLTNSATDSPNQTASISESPPLPDTAPSQPFSDANRLAAVFRTIDTWVELKDPNFHLITAMSANREKDGTFVGLDVSKEFCLILFGYKEKLYQQKDAQIALLAEHSKASDVYHQFKFMVSYLEAGRGSEQIWTFIQTIKQDINFKTHWQVAKEEEFKHAWHTLWNVLDFHPETDRHAGTFQGQIDIFFPPQSEEILASTSFSINLTDLESVDLRVKPTIKLHEHLLIEGDTVNIFRLAYEDIDTLRKFEKNRAAKVLGIATLGREILASLRALYGKDELFNKAEATGIFKAEGALERTVVAGFVRNYGDMRPKVLAYRAHTLQRVVEYRQSWWPSLVRDVKKQFQAQPLLFYGTMLAMFFGVCAVIQTVTSVWSLVLALRAK